jgi:beta-lactamase regulating signal transducer with metallopeptidase domain
MSETLNIALGWMIIHSLWQATLIALVTGLILVVLSKKTAKLRYIIANIGLLTVLLTAALTFAWYCKEATQTITIDAAPLLQKQAQTVQTTLEVSPKFTPNDVSPTSKLWSVANFKTYFEQNLPLVVLLWLIGVAVLLLRLVGSLAYIQYLRRRMNFPPDEYWTEMLSRLLAQARLSKTVELVESALVRTPMVVGHLKPLIMFPIGMINRLSEQEVEAILAHEIAHILRNDFIFNILQSVVEALFYYHPAVWLLSAQIRDERESACDEIAIDLIGGKTMNYAKALVVVQEMAFFPLSASLAFAGNRKNQFLLRLQRILHQPQNKSFLMEKLIATILVLFTLIGLSTAQQEQPKFSYSNIQPNSLMINGENSFSTKGYWNATLENDKVCLTLNNGSRNGNFITTECFDKAEFSALPSNTEGTFTLKRAAGTITFTGKFEGNEGYGKQVFESNAAFKTTLSQNRITNANDELTFFAFIAKADENYFSSLKSLNISGLDEEKMKAFLIHRITIEQAKSFVTYFKSKNYKNISAENIISYRIHDISPEFIANLEKQFGKNISPDDVLNAKIHGINDENIAAAKNLAGKDASFDDVITVQIHGVTQEFVNSFRSVGFTNLNLDEVTTLKIHAVTPDFVRSFFQVGLKNMNFEDAVALKIHDISPEFIKEQRKKGNNSNNAQDFVEIKLMGMANQDFRNQSFNVNEVPVEVDVSTDGYLQKLNAEQDALTAMNKSQNQRQKEMAERQKEIAEQQSQLQGRLSNLSTGKGYQSMHEDAAESIREEKALNWFMKELRKDKYFEIGKKTEFSITHKGMNVAGKSITESIFAHYKSNIEQILGKSMSKTFKYRFKGIITGIKGDSVEMNGEFDISTN